MFPRNVKTIPNVFSPYPRVEEKHISQVYVTIELKMELFCFFTVGLMVCIFRYLNLSVLLKSATTQNESKGVETN